MTPLDTPFRAQALGDLAVPVFLTLLLAHLSAYEVSLAQEVLAFLLCWMPWTSYRRWLQSKRSHIPLFALLATMFWLAYAVPLFWAPHSVSGIFGRRALSESLITQAMLLGVLGVACLWLGMRTAKISHWLPKVNRDVSSNPSKLAYMRIVFVLGTLIHVRAHNRARSRRATGPEQL